MENKYAIQIENVTKKYNLYANPQDRFREAVGLGGKKSLHSDFYALNGVSFDVKKERPLVLWEPMDLENLHFSKS